MMTLTILNGITYAALLFLVAVGMTLVFGVMRVVNMSHGAMYLASAYIAFTVAAETGLWIFGVLAGVAAGGLAGLILKYIVGRVDGDMPQTLLTLGITLALSDFCLWVWGGLPIRIEPPVLLSQPVHVFGQTLPGFRLFMLALAVVVGTALWWLLQRTQLGRMLRGGVDDKEMLGALGININLVFLWAFVISGALVGLAGAVGGSYMAFGPGTEFSILTFALVVVIIGGMGSIGGSAVGALIVGLVDALGKTYFPEVAAFLLMGTLVTVLAVRPSGLFSRSSK